MKVYVLKAQGYWDDHYILGVYSTEDKAKEEELADRTIKKDWYGQYKYYNIISYDLDDING